MEPSPNCIALIQKHEGFAPMPYICPAGWLTVGYGHVITPLEKKAGTYNNGVTKLEATRLLKQDIIKACNSVVRLITVPLAQGQFDALVSFVFNLGGGRLQSSTLRQKLNRGDYEGAAGEFKKWVYGGGRKLPGLIIRRREEADLFLQSIANDNEEQYTVLPWLQRGRG